MRNLLFKSISYLNYLVFSSITKIANALVFVNGRIGWILLNAIDNNRMHHAETAVEQQGEISELNVLFSIFQVRNSAMQSGMWNEDHEDQLNFLGNILANEHDWEVEQVERYLYEVIATGPDTTKE